MKVNIPVISKDGVPFYLDSKTVFDVTLDGERIVYRTVSNELYYHPLAIEEVALFLKQDCDSKFHNSNRKNLVNLDQVNSYDSECYTVNYNDEMSTGVSKPNLKEIKSLKNIIDKSTDSKKALLDEYSPIIRKKTLFGFK